MSIWVRHNIDEQQFYVEMNGQVAVLDYCYIDPEKVDVNHTFVPLSHRGQGVADQLMFSAVEWMESQGLELHASCRYAQVWLKRRKN